MCSQDWLLFHIKHSELIVLNGKAGVISINTCSMNNTFVMIVYCDIDANFKYQII